ncbi:MAG TPA: hypothetical protein PLR99_10545 [Polyangiaceae bacterium]|nr:hypothetical protein [Polyangiaceae bacterium]
MKKRVVQSRKLLVASIGVASVLYACEKRDAYPPGNLVAPPPDPTPSMVTSGNLVAPPTEVDAGAAPLEVTSPTDAAPPTKPKPTPTVTAPPHPTGPTHPPGNLMPPPPQDRPKPPMPKAK